MARALTRAEEAAVGDRLKRLHEHFHQWRLMGYEGHEHGLIAFAYYEGCGDSDCCGDLLAEAAPIALGAELVARHGFEWVAVPGGPESRLGVSHPALAEPIDLMALEDGRWYSAPSERTLARGEATHESLRNIVLAVGGTPPEH